MISLHKPITSNSPNHLKKTIDKLWPLAGLFETPDKEDPKIENYSKLLWKSKRKWLFDQWLNDIM